MRIVYTMPASKSDQLDKIIEQVLETNVKVFNLDNLPKEMYSSALSTYKLTKSQVSFQGSVFLVTLIFSLY